MDAQTWQRLTEEAITKNQGKTDPEDYLVAVLDSFAWTFDSHLRWELEQIAKQREGWTVVYTYYDQDGWPLFVGLSKNFYQTHRLNAKKFPFFTEVEYVDLEIWLNDEFAPKVVWKQYVRNRNPEYNTRKYENLPLNLDGIFPAHLVLRREMEQVWEDVRKQMREV